MPEPFTLPNPGEFKAFEATPGVSVVVFPEHQNFGVAAATHDFLALTGLSRAQMVGKNFFEGPAVRLAKRLGVAEPALRASFEKVSLRTGVRDEFFAQSSTADNDEEKTTRYTKVISTPVRDQSGSLLYIILTLIDTTEQMVAELKAEAVSGIEKAYMFFMQAPVVIGFVRGPNYIIELANEGLLKVWKVDAGVIGKSLFDVFPELETQGFRALLDNVRTTGQPYQAYEFPITFNRNGVEQTYYMDFVYQPFYEQDTSVASGVIAVGHDVTRQVEAKRQLGESEKKWRDLANAMPAIVWTAGPDGMVDFLNDRWYELTGRSEADSLGFNWSQALHPDDYDKCLAVWENARQKEILYEIEMRYRASNGEYVWAIARGVPVKANGKVIGWYGTSSEINKQKQLETSLEERVLERTSELREKNKLLDSILTHSSNGISVSELIFDSKGDVIDAQTILANDAAVNFIGLPKDLYLTKPATYFDPNIIASDYGKACINTLNTGEPFIMRYFLDFSKKWLELTVSRMDERHLIHIFTDVTTMKEAQAKLEKTLEDLRYSNANLEEFAYAASHDLKEPIRKYLFYTNRLKEELRDEGDAQKLSLIEKLEGTSMRMNQLVNDLLEYSQAAKGTSDFQPLNLGAIVQGVLEDLELEVQRSQAKITVNALPEVRGNKRQLQQLFQNLLANALKYRKRGAAPEISISSASIRGKKFPDRIPRELHENAFHLIQVRDNGIGFEQKYAESIFNVFTRLHSDFDYRGSGVGLSIVKRVVDGHHGYVWAESEPGKGALFTVILPVST